jgi:hypothetical protein
MPVSDSTTLLPASISRPGLRVVDWNEDRLERGIASASGMIVIGDPDDERAARFVHIRMAPGSPPRVRHAHHGWTSTIVLEGSLEIEGAVFTKGQMVIVEPNHFYGPLTPGREGATIIEMFHGDAAVLPICDETDPLFNEHRRRGWI